jgi:hypothetical protein
MPDDKPPGRLQDDLPDRSDDSLMDRFDASGSRRFRARDGIVAIMLAALILVLIQGSSIRRAGDQLNPGPGRDVVLAVGKPASWVADRLPLHTVAAQLTSGLSPDPKLSSTGGFGSKTQTTVANQVPQVTADSFTPATIGAAPAPKRALHTLLVTGDSLSTPLDLEVARRLAGRGVRVLRDPHLGTGISKTDLVDWGRLSVTQTSADHPDAVIVFIGANEGWPMPGPTGAQVQCCGADWAAIYANRTRQLMNTYRQGGAARVYWLTVPTPQEAARIQIERVVNAAINVAAQPWRDQVSVIDTVPIFTPGEKYRAAMPIAGQQTIVRESDGIHLNLAGSGLLAGIVLAQLSSDFRY